MHLLINQNSKIINSYQIIMTEFLVRVRRNNGAILQVFIKSDSSLQQLKQIISCTFEIQLQSFQLYSIGQLLDCGTNSFTLQKAGINQNSIIDIQPKINSSSFVMINIQYGINRVAIETVKQENIRSLKQRISDIFDCSVNEFDLMFKDEIISQDNTTILELGVLNNDLILVKRKIPMNTNLMNGLKARIRVVDSIASGSDNVDQVQRQGKEYSPLHKKIGFNVQKKSSCSASLRSIKDSEETQKPNLKHSSIQPYTMHKNQIDEVQQKQNRVLVKIQDIKQTMSFGSLEELRSQQSQVQICNEQKTIFYKFKCPLGCRISNLKKRLAQAQRTTIENLQIPNTNDNDLIDQLNQDQEAVSLFFRIIK